MTGRTSLGGSPSLVGTRVGRAVVLLVVTLFTLSLLTAVSVARAPDARAASADIGRSGQFFTGFATSTPTAPKPESKLWFAQGSWWADMASTASGGYRIARLDRTTSTWVDTGVNLDTRGNTQADVLWNGQHLFVASHVIASSSSTAAANQPARLLRYSWNGSAWSPDPGFPVAISTYSAEALTVAQDSTGRLWSTFTRNKRVYVASTIGGADAASVTFSTPAFPTLSNVSTATATAETTLSADDISAVVSDNGATTLLWSNQIDGTQYSARHVDGSADTWAVTAIVSGSLMSDDHINAKTFSGDAQGRIFAVLKTSRNDASPKVGSDPLLLLAVYSASSGTWTTTTLATVSTSATRPIVLLEPSTDAVHAYFTAPSTSGVVAYSGTIYEKTTSMSSPSFPGGTGTPILRDASTATMNNATSTKQAVDATTGRVVLAATEANTQYWHSDVAGSQPPPSPPVAAFTQSASSGTAPVAVSFTDTSTGSPTSWTWDFGDGAFAATANPSHTFTSAGTFTVTLTASNSGGPSTAHSTVTVTAQGPVVIDRVNAGGDVLTGGWLADTKAVPSVWVNNAVAKTSTSVTTSAIDMTDATIPTGTPSTLFQTGRFDTAAGTDMVWTLPTPSAGRYTVRLYFAETYWTAAGKRAFDVSINGTTVLSSFDIVAAAGAARKGVVRTFTVDTTGPITVSFGRSAIDNPLVNGIEVLSQ